MADVAPDYNDFLGGVFDHAIIGVGNTAVELKVAGSTPVQRNVIIQNKGTKSIFVGKSSVTSSGANEGYELNAGSVIQLALQSSAAIYAISANPTQDVLVWEWT